MPELSDEELDAPVEEATVESGIVAECVRDGHHQAISVLDLPLPNRRRKTRSGSPPTGIGRMACEPVVQPYDRVSCQRTG
jgi:hypothetical protein